MPQPRTRLKPKCEIFWTLPARILAAAEGEKKPAVEKLLNTKQAAAVLGCHPKTLLRYGLDGRLHPIRRSQRLIRWRQSEIEKMLMGEV